MEVLYQTCWWPQSYDFACILPSRAWNVQRAWIYLHGFMALLRMGGAERHAKAHYCAKRDQWVQHMGEGVRLGSDDKVGSPPGRREHV